MQEPCATATVEGNKKRIHLLEYSWIHFKDCYLKNIDTNLQEWNIQAQNGCV